MVGRVLIAVEKLEQHADASGEAAHLRELATKCLRAAGRLTDERHVASLRRMAIYYEAMADRIERPPMPHPPLPSAQ